MRTAALVAMLVLCACGPSIQAGEGEEVTLEVEPRTVSAGDSLTLVLRNGSAGEIGYNLCSSALEQQVNEEWRPIPSDRVCTMELRTLTPGETARYPLDVPGDLAPGQYRYITNVEMMSIGERGPVRSGTFQVTR